VKQRVVFKGHMHPRHSIDADKAANRSRFADTQPLPAVQTMRLAPLRRPSIIPLDSSLLGCFARWLRNLRIGGRV
jgi:hypothetical protein